MVKKLPMDLAWLVVAVIFHWKGVLAQGSLSQIACHGDIITLRCGPTENIKIKDAIYQIIDQNSLYCRHVNRTSTSCHDQPLRQRVSDLCAGKDVCKLSQGIENDVRNECRSSMYLKVLYECIKNVQAVPAVSAMSTSMITKPTQSSVTPFSSGSSNDRDLSIYLRLVVLFMELHAVPSYIAESPRKAALCLILSLAFGISLIIVYMLVIACCHRFGRKKRNDSASDVARDEEDGVKAVLISSPMNTLSTNHSHSQTSNQPMHYETVLVTRQNGVPLHETTISSDSTLLTKKNKKHQGHAEVISTIKRTHSVDEGTQTDNEDNEDGPEHKSRTLSVKEVQELGDMVDNLNYYNSRIDDDDAFYPHFTGNQLQSKKLNHRPYEPASHSEHPGYYYANRGPSYDDEGRSSSNNSSNADRQPLLTNNRNPPPQPSPYYNNRNNHKLPSERKTLSRNPSELSYATSSNASNASDSSLTNYTAEGIFNGDNLRYNSIQRTAKPGVRGDGFEFIVNSSSRSNSSK